jgi:hypothetical protein
MPYSRISVLLLLAVSLSPAPAFAETTWDTLQRFGWTGSWAGSCKDPPSIKNVWVILSRDPDGAVKRKLDRGDDGPPLMGVVDSAQILTPSTLQARLRNDDANWGPMNGAFFDVIQTIESDRVRTLQSKGGDGKDYVKDGIGVPSGQPSPWTYRCSN